LQVFKDHFQSLEVLFKGLWEEQNDKQVE